MALTGLKGPFRLTHEKIDEVVTQTSPGAYALGRYDGAFYISYVGRSDDDINKRLHDWAGEYSYFKFDYFPSAKAAYEKECRLWHDFRPPDNKSHPSKPEGSGWKCPVCGE